jgi:hypothetical protein
MKLDRYTIAAALLMGLIAIGLLWGIYAIQANSINNRYGTDFTAWEVMWGVHKHYRNME